MARAPGVAAWHRRGLGQGQSVVPLHAGGVPWPLLVSSRSCPLIDYIAFHDSLLLQLHKI